MSGDGKKTRHTFPRRLRLIKTADFGVVVRTRNEHTFRSDAVFFSAQCMRRPEAPGELRFGVTVGKKNAKRAVDRALVKRILRESARMQAPALLTMLGQRGLGLDVSLRLKTPLAQAGDRTAVRALKRALRADADKLMGQICRRVRKTPAAAPKAEADNVPS